MARQPGILANQVNKKFQLMEGGPPARAQHIGNAVKRLLDQWANTIVPLFVSRGLIPAAIGPQVVECLQDVGDGIP